MSLASASSLAGVLSLVKALSLTSALGLAAGCQLMLDDSPLPPASSGAREPLPRGARPGKGKVDDLVAGAKHTCALLDTGQVRCWGAGSVIGYGGAEGLIAGENVGDDELPAEAGFVDLGGPVAQISAGDHHTCALLDSGEVRCWGDSTHGQLGYGDFKRIGDDEAPASLAAVDVGAEVQQLVAGSESTCALLEGGQLSCWGEWNAEPSTSAQPPQVWDPSAMGTISALGLGSVHACVVLEDRSVRCWGQTADGRLGLGRALEKRVLPEGAEMVNVGAPVKQLAVGSAETCVVTEAGRVRCWGRGLDGRLGYGNLDSVGDDETPAQAGDVEVGGPVRSIGLRDKLACALLEAGTVRCWGPGFGWHPLSPSADAAESDADDRCASLGVDGDERERICGGTRLGACCASYAGALGYGVIGAVGDDEPPAAAGDIELAEGVEKLAVGGEHACVLLKSGGVQCWGSARDGQLGYGNDREIGDDEAPSSAGFVDVAGAAAGEHAGTKVVQLAAGTSHTCGVLDSGAVRCWGRGAVGQLGYGSTEDVGDDEAPRDAGDVELRGHARQIVAGGDHTCAILDSGAVRCWGDGRDGVLGNERGDPIGDDEVPGDLGYVDVGGPVAQMSIGEQRACAVLRGGALRCWGALAWSALGRPGLDALGDDERPRDGGDVDVGGPVSRVAVGRTFTCASLVAGGVRCWWQTELGVHAPADSGAVGSFASPAEVPALDLGAPLSELVVSPEAVCALAQDGKVRCAALRRAPSPARGDPRHGAVTEVPLDGAATRLSVGDTMGCAVLGAGGVRCWSLASTGSQGTTTAPFSEIELLGNGSPFLPPQSYPADPSVSQDPDRLDLVLNGSVDAIAFGGSHTCALMSEGTVRCWGQREAGATYSSGLFDGVSDVRLF